MKHTVLIVDDFKNTRFVIKLTIGMLGCNILEAENGKEALKFFDGRHIDLVITDLNMPVMDGLELTREIRKMLQYSKVPILMLTTETSKDKKIKAQEDGITGWILKPYNNDTLIKIVKKALR